MRKSLLNFSEDSKSINMVAQPLTKYKIKSPGKLRRKVVDVEKGDFKPSKRFGWNNGRRDSRIFQGEPCIKVRDFSGKF